RQQVVQRPDDILYPGQLRRPPRADAPEDYVALARVRTQEQSPRALDDRVQRQLAPARERAQRRGRRQRDDHLVLHVCVTRLRPVVRETFDERRRRVEAAQRLTPESLGAVERLPAQPRRVITVTTRLMKLGLGAVRVGVVAGEEVLENDRVAPPLLNHVVEDPDELVRVLLRAESVSFICGAADRSMPRRRASCTYSVMRRCC